MGESPTYEELVAQVRLLQSRQDERIANYVWIKREPSDSVPASLDGGSAVLTSTGLHFGIDGGVGTATLA